MNVPSVYLFDLALSVYSSDTHTAVFADRHCARAPGACLLLRHRPSKKEQSQTPLTTATRPLLRLTTSKSSFRMATLFDHVQRRNLFQLAFRAISVARVRFE